MPALELTDNGAMSDTLKPTQPPLPDRLSIDPRSPFHVPAVFERVDWSTDRVLAQTRERLRDAGATWQELPVLWDVDEPADWLRWRRAFADAPRVTFAHYETLNHLGIAGEGDGNLAEYNTPGHVDATLIADVAGWIKAR